MPGWWSAMPPVSFRSSLTSALLAVAVLAVSAVALSARTYGSATSLNSGYVVVVGSMCVGYETRGAPGWFAGCD